mmetsp:Transcript_98855/g.250894  ORF Transcript_98855/g.250894 Transcript_98855/m.250894 type:complete len:628 (-) Transcript_98855:294-2177(-)|eukprot:CAMPEP_0183399502 /NCGR_PEP_ID=MMETSP0370-20130417/11977_1 /TAXON_ID=268820 /ORGANISM="Peridinium aciculiferum, Strain PAER-2" /LENGTH=627 /DNA_ID=CAMNT_0025580671 /DNA_START=17 /DNA_END=1900 /DNA_ORIENTATION=+
MVAMLRSLALATGLVHVVAAAASASASAPLPSEEALLAGDSECGGGAAGAEQCSLNALQRRAAILLETRGDPEVIAEAYQQCGGDGWTGATTCGAGYKCASKDHYYGQCIPEGDSLPPAAAPSPPQVQANAAIPTTPQPSMEPLKANPPTPEPPTVQSVNPIVIKGNFLYDSVTGKRFFAKGTSYNPRMESYDPNGRSKGKPCAAGNAVKTSYTADVISDSNEQRWTEDLKAIANMGANTIRLFNIDAGQDHTKFMTAAASYGIYVIIPLNSKDYGFLPAFPSPSCYTMNMTFEVANSDGSTRPYGNVGVNVLSYGKQIVKQFSQYDNLLFFTVNNEFAMNDKEGFAGFQCVKALTRDIHQYQRSCAASMRRVPLIYSDYDMGPPDRAVVARYLTCALDSEDDAIDAYGLNVYSYCEKAYPGDGKADNFEYSPYKDIKKDFKDFSVPVLFTEFGCVEGDFLSFCPYKGGRTWPDVKLFFNEELGEILSGAIAYTWEMDFEERGMVLTPGYLANQTELYLLDNYYALQQQFQKYDVMDKWDGADTTDCSWTPDKAAPQKAKHTRPMCPSSKAGQAVQKRRRTSTVTDWQALPPSAVAPLSDVNGQAECPSYEVAPAMAAEGKCHMGSD